MHIFITICIFDKKKKNMTNEEKYKSLGAMSNHLIDVGTKIAADRADNTPSDWVSNKSTRHSGSFSANNPYFTQLNRAGSKADEDALFELAVKWEAEQAGYQQERADKYADLLEQRAYDDPTAVVSRNRRAGINSDLVGASGAVGSGSGSSATADMPSLSTPTDNTSHFSNQVDRHSMILGAVDSVAGLLGAFSSLGSAVTNSISTLTMLPIAKRAGELSNQLADEMRPHQVSLAEKLSQGQQIANDTADLDLINKSLGTLNSLSGFITPETSDDDATNILSSLGFDSAKIPSLLTGVKQWHSNPQYKANWEKSKQQAIEAEEYGKTYTRDYISGILGISQQLETTQLNLDFALKDLELKVANLLNTDDYAQDVAGNTQVLTSLSTKQAGYDSKQLDLLRQQLDRDFVAFENQLEFLVVGRREANNLIQEIKRRAVLNGRALTAEENAIIDNQYQLIYGLDCLGSQYLGNATRMITKTVQNRYFSRFSLGNNGLISPEWAFPNQYNFMRTQISFDQVTSGIKSTSDVATDIKDGLIDGLKILL